MDKPIFEDRLVTVWNDSRGEPRSIATHEGSKLLTEFDRYYWLARSRRGQENEELVALRTLGLIILDAGRKDPGPGYAPGDVVSVRKFKQESER